MTLLKTIATMLQEMASHSGSLFNKTMPDEHLINKIELKFMWNDGTTMHAQVVNFELEYFVIVQLSGSTESTIQRINAAKAEYVTMMINSLSHEILTPIAEILKNCQSYKLKSRTLGGNTNNTPFQNLNPSMSRFLC